MGATGTLNINEGSKTTGSRLVFRPTAPLANDVMLATNLYRVTNVEEIQVDGTLHLFDPTYNNAVDFNDVRKNPNFGENLAILKFGKELAVEKRPLLNTGTDTIVFKMYQMTQANYKLEFAAANLCTDGSKVGFIEDTYLNVATPLSLTDTTYYNFTVDANAGSAASNRFRIVFRTQGALPVSITQVKAALQSSKIAVEWKVENQQNVVRYEIEKSTDSRHFATVGTQLANGTNGSSATYNWLDINVANGANLYRIKSVDATGSYKYSTIVKVLVGKTAPAITVSPNPIEGGIMNVQMVNQPAGKYSIRLTNAIGQTMLSRSTEHTGGSITQSFVLPSLPVTGTYQLEVIAPDNSKQIQQVLINSNK